MALGWGLWEGPARFIFLGTFFARIRLPGINNSAIAGIDFRKKWHNIRHGKASLGSFDRMKQQGHR